MPLCIDVTYMSDLYIAVLVQMGGVTFLTDPVFAQRCSASQWVGPKRYTKPAMQLNELPSIDFVLLSHNHYDHLCSDSVKAIGNNPLWIVPEGLKQVCMRYRVRRYTCVLALCLLSFKRCHSNLRNVSQRVASSVPIVGITAVDRYRALASAALCRHHAEHLISTRTLLPKQMQ
jgi:Beta-lactamase superfamily domain